MEELRRQFEVNVFGVVTVIKAVRFSIRMWCGPRMAICMGRRSRGVRIMQVRFTKLRRGKLTALAYFCSFGGCASTLPAGYRPTEGITMR
jgi:hypothetical protein